MRKTLGKVTNCLIAEEFLTQIENLFLSTYKSEKNAEGSENEHSLQLPVWILALEFWFHFLISSPPLHYVKSFRIVIPFNSGCKNPVSSYCCGLKTLWKLLIMCDLCARGMLNANECHGVNCWARLMFGKEDTLSGMLCFSLQGEFVLSQVFQFGNFL